MSRRLLDYALDDALDHFGYLGSKFESAVPDVTVLAEDIRQHSEIWDNVCIPARWKISTKPRWPAARHDLLLYILVAYAPKSFMNAFFRDNALKPKEGTNPLVYAAHFDKDEHARTLLFRGARLHDRGWETSGFRQSLPIEVAFQNRHHAMITHFVEEGSTVPPHIFTDSFFEFSRLFDAIPSFIARVLVQTDDFAENINNCLSEAARCAITTSNQLLVFRDATEQDLITIIRRFLQVADEHFTLNSIREAFFCFAVAQGYFSAARYLLTLGTPLPSDVLVRLHHHSGKWKTVHMIQFLVDNGADVLVHTSDRDSVLHAILWAPGENLYSIVDADEDDILGAVKLLVGYGCNPLEADSRGNTPLRIAVERGHMSVARHLLSLGAPLPDLFVTLNGNQSPWTTASMIRFLVENGANALSHSSCGDSVLHMVLESFYDNSETLEVVKLLVGYGCNPLEANSHGNTPLHIAVQRGLISAAQYLLTLGAPLPPDLLVTLKGYFGARTAPMIRFLVENGVDVLACASNGDSLLHTVVQFLNDENEALGAVKLLVGSGCDPLEANSRGATPLHFAVERGHISVARHLLALGASLPPDLLVTLSRDQSHWETAPMIRFLVENGVDVLARTSNGDSLLHNLLQSLYNENEVFETVKLLVGYGCDPLEANPRGATPLHIAVERGHISVARYLLTLGAPLPPDLLVTLGGDQSRWTTVPMIRFLVENGANALSHNSNGDSVLHITLQFFGDDNDALEVVKLLVDHGCNPLEANSQGNTPFHIAVERGHFSAAQYLLTLGAALPPDLLVTLKGYCWGRRTTPMIRFLVENGADVLARDSNGDSLLHNVLQLLYDENEAFETIKLLVGYGCDPLGANSHGDTPLHIAIERRHISVARHLLTLGAPLSPDLLVTRRYYWLNQSTIAMTRFLVENGVDVLARASDGDSVLHIALQFSCDDNEALEVAKLLVGCGCDPFEANFRGDTPLHIAVRRGHISVARYLITLGAPLLPDLLVTSKGYWLGSTAPMIRCLVENGVNIQDFARASNGDSLIHNVFQSLYGENEAFQTVKLLVGYGCNPLEADFHGNTLLHIAVQRGYLSVVRYLLTLGAPLPPNILVTLFRDRLHWSTTPMIRFLVKNGVDVFAHGSDGDSVLHVALLCFNDAQEILEAVKLLVGYGCNPLEANCHGNTPLHIAVERGHISAAQYFLTLGTPLPPDLLVTFDHDRSRWSTAPMIHSLVENGVDVHARASDGDSVLHIALRCFRDDDKELLEAVKALVGYGCDPLEANFHGHTPLHIAVERGHISTARYLLTLGASLTTDLLQVVTFDRDRLRWSTAPMIHFLVENGLDVHARTSDGDSALHIALQCFHYYDDEVTLEAVKVLVGCGCDPLEANCHGNTPLRIAVERGHISVARYLLTLGAHLPPDLLVTFNRDWSCWSTPMIRFLVENGVDIFARSGDGDSVLHIVLQRFHNDDKGTLETVKVLLGYGCDPLEANFHGHTPLHIAVERGHISAARYLLTLQVGTRLPPDLLVKFNRGWSRCSSAPMIHFLVENGVDVHARASDGDSALHIALQCFSDDDKETLEAVKVLVGYGCDPLGANSHGNTPLHIAVEQGHISAAQYLLTLGAPLPPDILVTFNRDWSCWSTAPMIRFLVKNGVDVHAYASDGESVLHMALQCFNGDGDVLDAVKLLVGYDCDSLEANSRGETPLHVAAERGYVSVARYLITQGASVLTKASNGDTALHFATNSVYPYGEDEDGRALEAVKFFVRCGCELTAPNDDGETPLHIAVDLGRIKTIKYLLSLNIPLPSDILFTAIESDDNSAYCRHITATLVTSGCDARTPNADGDTPLRVAIMKGKVDVVEYLLSVVSEYNPPLEDLLLATALAPPSVQSEMRHILSDRRARSESPDLPPTKRAKLS